MHQQTKDRSSVSTAVKQKAQSRLSQVMNRATEEMANGWHGVEVLFRNGQAQTVRSRTEHTEQ